MIFKRRRRITYPNVLDVRMLRGPGHPCECCREVALYAIQYETSEHSPVAEMYCCARHEGMARRRQWVQVFADQDKKISSFRPEGQ
jgi:hypothetical protein